MAILLVYRELNIYLEEKMRINHIQKKINDT